VVPSLFLPIDIHRSSVSFQLMGIETSLDHGGSGSSFTSAIIAIEELAKVDPSVSVLCDVHNTLINTVVRTYGTQEQQDKWLPMLAQKSVSNLCTAYIHRFDYGFSSVHSVYRNLPQVPMHLHSKPAPRGKATTIFLTAPRCGLPTHMKLISSLSSRM
jgi:hypothetical protein